MLLPNDIGLGWTITNVVKDPRTFIVAVHMEHPEFVAVDSRFDTGKNRFLDIDGILFDEANIRSFIETL